MPIDPRILAAARARPSHWLLIDGHGVLGVMAQEGPRRGQVNGIQVEDREGRMSAHVHVDGIRETIHVSDYGYSRKEREELKALLTRGRARRVAGPAPHQLASGLLVPKGEDEDGRSGRDPGPAEPLAR